MLRPRQPVNLIANSGNRSVDVGLDRVSSGRLKELEKMTAREDRLISKDVNNSVGRHLARCCVLIDCVRISRLACLYI